MNLKKKILVVDDSNTILTAIKSIISESSTFEAHYATSFAEAKKLIAVHDFFAAILDLQLPDSQNGELVDYAISKKIRSVVLTATFDDEVRKKIIRKPIADYLVKNSIEDIRNAVDVLHNLIHFDMQRALVVDDSRLSRMELRKLFEALGFEVIEAEDGLCALALLDNGTDIDVMSIDYEMPGMNGIELIKKIRNKNLPLQPLIFAVSSNESAADKARFIKSGANDFFAKPVQKEEFNHKLGNFFQILSQKKELIRTQKILQAEQSRHSAYMKMLFDKNPNIAIVIDQNGLANANDKFFEYFIHYKNIDDFKARHQCISELFEYVDDPHFLHPNKRNWLEHAISHPHSHILVKDGNKHFYFNVSADEARSDEQVFYIITFTDITRTYLLQKQFEEYSMVDDLTKVYNRRFFNIMFEKEIARARRDNKKLTFLMIDVDNFKRYNDFYGHDAGDDVLSSIGQTMQKHLLRASDYLFRLGGEEFGVLFLDQNLEASEIYANVIRESISALNLPHENNRPYACVTASIGLCNVDFALSDNDEKQIYMLADRALYKAKENGRNRVQSYAQSS